MGSATSQSVHLVKDSEYAEVWCTKEPVEWMATYEEIDHITCISCLQACYRVGWYCLAKIAELKGVT